MSLYSKYLIIVACIGLLGIPLLMLDFNNLLWKNNKETYWGMIALIALISAVLLENRATSIKNKIKDDERINKDGKIT